MSVKKLKIVLHSSLKIAFSNTLQKTTYGEILENFFNISHSVIHCTSTMLFVYDCRNEES